MFGNDESSSRDFGDSLQFTNWILDSVPTCHMTQQVSDFIPNSFDNTDKYIDFFGVSHVMAKQKVQVQIQICDDNGDTFIATLNNVLLAPDLRVGVFSIITIMNSKQTCLFQKGFCTV